MLTKMTMAVVLTTTLMTSSVPLPSSFEKAKGLIVENDEQQHHVQFKSSEERLKDFEKEVEKKAEDNKRKKLEEERQRELLKNEREERGNKQTFVLTYYGSTDNECGNSLGITASGKKVSRGMVASPPSLKFGTKIQINGNVYTVEDRGASKYIRTNNDGSIRLDVYVPRESGESDYQYEKRVNKMGVQRVEGYILN